MTDARVTGRKVEFLFEWRACYTHSRPGESPMDSVARSIQRRVKPLGGVTLWGQNGQGDLYVAKWTDGRIGCERSAPVQIGTGPMKCEERAEELAKELHKLLDMFGKGLIPDEVDRLRALAGKRR